GADVIKIESPNGGDFARHVATRRGGFSASFLNNNRNKRSVVLDLKSESGIEALKAIIADADVFVQNFRPGVVERLGIDESAVRARSPNIIYVSMNGFGEIGPMCDKPAYDPIIQALTGLASVQGGSDEARPRLVRTILPDKLTGMTAAQAISSALYARAQTGEGQHVKVSMTDSVLAFLWSSDYGSQTFVDRPVSVQKAASFIDLIYATADGYMTVAVNSDKEWQALTRALDKPEWLEDPRFLTPTLREANINDRLSLIQEVLETRPTAAWVDRLEAENVPCAQVLHRKDVIHHPQIVASGILVETDHPEAGRLLQTRNAARFDKTPAAIRWGAPRLGAHNDEVLGAAGYTEGEIDALRRQGVIGEEPEAEAAE
ncbi:MAG: CoA transferase, partial [Alphaproteobacteria bacterium]|nr:CoA transferase [Alphaproteobacteria bacterium]